MRGAERKKFESKKIRHLRVARNLNDAALRSVDNLSFEDRKHKIVSTVGNLSIVSTGYRIELKMVAVP
ncbi:hypothetical protein V6N11_004123 [Hibiscus sabdariffa]|uniref:Uncharacterized protein n=1 Tax=Hibiscus sabdariffa TaxID=183260 RepID=A0ABR2SF87_9ROSI